MSKNNSNTNSNTNDNTTSVLEFKLPEDTHAERSLIATLCAPGSETLWGPCAALLAPEDFVHPAYREVWIALCALREVEQEVNSLTLKDRLDAVGRLNRVGAYPGLVEILAGEDVERPIVLAQIVKEKSRLRKLVHLGAQVVRTASLADDTSANLMSSASALLVDLSRGAVTKGLVPIGEAGERAWERVEAIRSGKAAPGIPTGFSRLDAMMGGGFKPGQSILLAARPGIGKSTLLAQWMTRIAARIATSAMFCLEMSDEEIWTRMAGSFAKVSGGAISTGKFGVKDYSRLMDAREEIKALPLRICDQASITVPEIRSMVSNALVGHGKLGMVGIDYLQLLSSPRNSQAAKQNESVRVGEISRQIKLMAKDLAIPVITLSQLNREIEHRNGSRPQLSDLRDSGSLEQDADVVIFLHQKGEAGSPDAQYELVIPKNRNGAKGVIPLSADLEHFTFSEVTRETEPFPFIQGDMEMDDV